TLTSTMASVVMSPPAGIGLGSEVDRAGRVKVLTDLSVPGHPKVFVIGDTAAVAGPSGVMLAGVAPVAKQQGQYVARALMARHQGRTATEFRYRDYGSLATIGRSRAVAQFGKLRLSGFPASALWRLAHL